MLWIPTDRLQVDVDRGEVVLRGEVDSEIEAELLGRRVKFVPGVVGVRSELRWSLDRKGRPVNDAVA